MLPAPNSSGEGNLTRKIAASLTVACDEVKVWKLIALAMCLRAEFQRIDVWQESIWVLRWHNVMTLRGKLSRKSISRWESGRGIAEWAAEEVKVASRMC